MTKSRATVAASYEKTQDETNTSHQIHQTSAAGRNTLKVDEPPTLTKLSLEAKNVTSQRLKAAGGAATIGDEFGTQAGGSIVVSLNFYAKFTPNVF